MENSKTEKQKTVTPDALTEWVCSVVEKNIKLDQANIQLRKRVEFLENRILDAHCGGTKKTQLNRLTTIAMQIASKRLKRKPR